MTQHLAHRITQILDRTTKAASLGGKLGKREPNETPVATLPRDLRHLAHYIFKLHEEAGAPGTHDYTLKMREKAVVVELFILSVASILPANKPDGPHGIVIDENWGIILRPCRKVDTIDVIIIVDSNGTSVPQRVH